ncbi:hypothetical protein [Agrococcus terreus]|uniref:hypothetical protein n=1 Tax=Agrococcus terreus TaxID=574649 RepID=UPI001669BEAB|nr:hypothetical protein [Agrococcus terreus]
MIAILAAITAVAYTGIRDRAALAALQSELSGQARQLAAYRTQNNDQYPATLAAARTAGTATRPTPRVLQQASVYDDIEGVRIDSERTEFSRTLHEWIAQRRLAEAGHITGKKKRASRISAEGSLPSTSIGLNESNGLSNSISVGLTGFEPATP